MAVSLYDVSVASYVQMLTAMEGVLEKGRSHLVENGQDLDDLVATSLYPDMLPFRFQVISVAHHSMGTLKGLAAGEFSPPDGYGEPDYEGLQALVGEAKAYVESLHRETVESFEGKPVIFRLGGNELPFTGENFIMSFSLPNLYFHAATTYDILRMKGVPLGKRDFMGPMRMGA